MVIRVAGYTAGFDLTLALAWTVFFTSCSSSGDTQPEAAAVSEVPSPNSIGLAGIVGYKNQESGEVIIVVIPFGSRRDDLRCILTEDLGQQALKFEKDEKVYVYGRNPWVVGTEGRVSVIAASEGLIMRLEEAKEIGGWRL